MLKARNMTPQEKQQIIAGLNKARAKLPCPRCANDNFIVLDGYTLFPVHSDRLTLGFGVIGGGARSHGAGRETCSWRAVGVAPPRLPLLRRQKKGVRNGHPMRRWEGVDGRNTAQP